MRTRICLSVASLALASIAAFSAAPAFAQNAKTETKSGIKRMPDGHPDLQGIYDLATMTPMERLPGLPATLTKEEAKKLQDAEADRRKNDGGALPGAGQTKPATSAAKPATSSFFELLERAGG